MKIIIAGNYQEFIRWCRENSFYARDPDLIFPAYDLSNLRGIGNSVTEVHYVGQWMNWGGLGWRGKGNREALIEILGSISAANPDIKTYRESS